MTAARPLRRSAKPRGASEAVVRRAGGAERSPPMRARSAWSAAGFRGSPSGWAYFPQPTLRPARHVGVGAHRRHLIPFAARSIASVASRRTSLAGTGVGLSRAALAQASRVPGERRGVSASPRRFCHPRAVTHLRNGRRSERTLDGAVWAIGGNRRAGDAYSTAPDPRVPRTAEERRCAVGVTARRLHRAWSVPRCEEQRKAPATTPGPLITQGWRGGWWPGEGQGINRGKSGGIAGEGPGAPARAATLRVMCPFLRDTACRLLTQSVCHNE